jgi:hypothetical protein
VLSRAGAEFTLLRGSNHPIRWHLTVLSVVAGLVAPLCPDRTISSNNAQTASSLTRRRAPPALVFSATQVRVVFLHVPDA